MDFSDAGLSHNPAPVRFDEAVEVAKKEQPVSGIDGQEQQLSFADSLVPTAIDPDNGYSISQIVEDSALLGEQAAQIHAAAAERSAISNRIQENLGDPLVLDYITRQAYDPVKQAELRVSAIERRYADTVEDNVVMEGWSPSSELIETNPEYGYAVNHSIAINASVNNLIAKLDKEWKEGRTYAGLAVDFLSSAIPFWEAYKLGLDPITGETWKPGENELIEIGRIWAMPTEQAIATIKRMYDEVKGNAFTAYRFLNSIQHYSSTDAFVENVFGVVDAAGVATSSVKLLGKGIRGANNISNATALAGSPRAAAKLASNGLKLALKGAINNKHKASAVAKAVYSAFDLTKRGTPDVKPVPNAAAGGADYIRETDRMRRELFQGREREGVWVVRTEDEGLQMSRDEAITKVLEEFSPVGDENRILDISPPIRDPKTNSHHIDVTIGVGGEVFPDPRTAEIYAEDIHNFPEGFYTIEPYGGGHVIRVQRPLNERLWSARNDLVQLDSNNDVKAFGPWYKFFYKADLSFSDFERKNRGIAASLASKKSEALGEFFSRIRFENKRSKKAMSQVLRRGYEARDMFNQRGKWFNARELDDQFQSVAGRNATPMEHQTYHAIKTMYDVAYSEEMWSLYKNMESRGFMEISMPDKWRTNVHAREVPSSDLGKLDDGIIGRPVTYQNRFGDTEMTFEYNVPEAIMRKLEEGRHVARKDITTISELETMTVRELVEDQGYKVYEMSKVMESVDSLGAELPVKYILSKPLPARRLQPGESILPYREGGHQAVKGEWFVKVPMDYLGFYTGDKTLFNFGTEAAAKAAAKDLNEAMRRYKQVVSMPAGAERGLAMEKFHRSVRNKFNMSENQWNNMVRQVSSETPFTATKGSTRALADKNLMSLTTTNDELDSVYQMMDYKNFSFVGNREDTKVSSLNRVKATAGSTWKQGEAQYIDPLEALERTASHLQTLGAYEDYAFQGITDWVARYRRVLEFTDEELRNNPTAAFMNPRYRQNVTNAVDKHLIQQAQAQHSHIVDFLQTPTPTSKWLRSVREELLEWAGEEAYDADNVAWRIASKDYGNDPFSMLKAITFRTAMGLYSPVQFTLQASAVGIASAIDPSNIRAGMGLATSRLAYGKMRFVGRNASTDAMFAKLSGHTAEEVLEFNKYLDDVGGLAMDNTLSDLSVGFSKKSGGVQTLGAKATRGFFKHDLAFFKEGERLLRLYSHSMAYSWWKKKNPGVALDNKNAHIIRDRASTLFTNMSRESNSYWQRGFLSIPAQFSGFFIRYHELLLKGGAGLSKKERVSLFLAMTAAYGTAGSTFLGDLAGDAYTKATSEEGGPVEPGMNLENLMLNGIFDAITGYSTSERFAPGKGQLTQALTEKDLMMAMSGPSGSKIYQAIKDLFYMDLYAGPALIMRGIWGNGVDDPDSIKPGVELMLSSLRNITSVSNAYKSMVALNTERYISKSGILLKKDMTPMDSIVLGLFGVEPSEVTLSRDYLYAENRSSEGYGPDITKDIIMNFHQKRMNAMLDNDMEAAQNYTAAVVAFYDIMDISDEDRGRYGRMFFDINTDYIEKARIKSIKDFTGPLGDAIASFAENEGL